jgi:hypothetical protein
MTTKALLMWPVMCPRGTPLLHPREREREMLHPREREREMLHPREREREMLHLFQQPRAAMFNFDVFSKT